MRVLWTLPYLPWPITSGGKARQFHLIKAMAQRGHDITLLVQSKTPLDDKVQAMLTPWVKQLIVLPRRPLLHPKTLWHVLTSHMPLLSTVNGYAPALSNRFTELLSQSSWDMIQIEHSYAFAPFEAALKQNRSPVVITEHNVESRLGAATYGKWPWWAKPWAWVDQQRAERWERHALSQADMVVAVTEADSQALREISGGRAQAVVNNGVDTAAFADVQANHAACTVLFVGNFEYAPNVDALRWLLSDIAPQLWQQVPQAKFILCGHGLPLAWQNQFKDARIIWQGYVEKLQTAQSQASVFVAPLRFGGGSKLKVLEAMAAGLPVVSTKEGLSGLDAVSGEHALAADSAQALANALAHLLQDPARASQISIAGRAFVQNKFDWQASAAQLEAAYVQALTASSQKLKVLA